MNGLPLYISAGGGAKTTPRLIAPNTSSAPPGSMASVTLQQQSALTQGVVQLPVVAPLPVNLGLAPSSASPSVTQASVVAINPNIEQILKLLQGSVPAASTCPTSSVTQPLSTTQSKLPKQLPLLLPGSSNASTPISFTSVIQPEGSLLPLRINIVSPCVEPSPANIAKTQATVNLRMPVVTPNPSSGPHPEPRTDPVVPADPRLQTMVPLSQNLISPASLLLEAEELKMKFAAAQTVATSATSSLSPCVQPFQSTSLPDPQNSSSVASSLQTTPLLPASQNPSTFLLKSDPSDDAGSNLYTVIIPPSTAASPGLSVADGTVVEAQSAVFNIPNLGTTQDLATNQSAAGVQVFNVLVNTEQCAMEPPTTQVISSDNVSSTTPGLAPPSYHGDHNQQQQPKLHGKCCVDCGLLIDANALCCRHGHQMEVKKVADSLIPSRARATLPSVLTFMSSRCDLGVFARERIPKGTQFDPLEGHLQPASAVEFDLDTVVLTSYLWELFEADKSEASHILDCRDESVSNWPVFMSIARTSEEQNVSVFQVDRAVVFVTCKDILPGSSLCFWYSKQYAKLLGVPEKPESPFKCTLCGKALPSRKAVQKHHQYQHADPRGRKWQCTYCNKYFQSSSKLKTHMASHTGEKPHKCDLCGKQFTDQSNLRMHYSVHTGERKFKCPVCAKSYRQKAHMLSHMLVHSGAKTLPCEFCGVAFARASDLKTHRYKHTREKEYACEHASCDKVFYKLQNYKKHLRVHTGTRDFKCPQCEKSFVTKFHVARHLKSCRVGREDEAGPIDLGGAVTKKPRSKRKQKGVAFTNIIDIQKIKLTQRSPVAGLPVKDQTMDELDGCQQESKLIGTAHPS